MGDLNSIRASGRSASFRVSSGMGSSVVIRSKSYSDLSAKPSKPIPETKPETALLPTTAPPVGWRKFVRGFEVRTLKVLKSTVYISAISIVLVYSLFIDDLRLIISPGPVGDAGVDATIITCIVLLAIDVLVQVAAKPVYLFGFPFTSEVLAVAFLPFQLMGVSDAVGGRYTNLTTSIFSIELIYVCVLISKICRLMRLVRIIRLSKSVKQFRSFFQRRKTERKFKEKLKRQQSVTNPFARAIAARRGLSQVELPSKGSKSTVARLMAKVSKDGGGGDDGSENSEEATDLPADMSGRSKSVLFTSVPTELINDLKEESKVARQLTEITIAKVGTTVCLCAILGPLLSHISGESPLATTMITDSTATGFARWQIGGDVSRPDYDFNLASSVGSLINTGHDLNRLGWIGFSPPGNPVFNQSAVTGINEILTNFQIDQLTTHWDLSCPTESAHTDIPNGVWVFLVPHSASSCPFASLRLMETSVSKSVDSKFVFILNHRTQIARSAILSLAETIFYFIVIFVVSFVYTRDCAGLVLVPIGRMTRIVNQIKANPLVAVSLSDRETKRDLQYHSTRETWEALPLRLRVWGTLRGDKPNILVTDAYRKFSDSEIVRLEQTILRIGTLLVVGFGEAGTGIIGKNMRNFERGMQTAISGGSGTRIEAVFGHINIIDFPMITEVLQSGIVVLVNQVADVVHGLVDEFSGFVCHNTGSGFFVVWKLPPEQVTDEDSEEDPLYRRERICELAVTAVCEIHAAIAKSPVLALYREDPRFKCRVADYKVRVGVGLHLGWGVEGAIGSDFKLEASYLGHNTVLAEKLESVATNVYHTNIVLSAPVFACLGEEFRRTLCRRIDRVHVDGAPEPIDLYTVDLDTNRLHVAVFANSTEKGSDAVRKQILNDYIAKRNLAKRKQFRNDLFNSFNPVAGFATGELSEMRTRFETSNGEIFRQLFEKGLVNYLCGEFDLASHALRQTAVFWRNHLSREERAEAQNISKSTDFPPNMTTAQFVALMDTKERGIDGPSVALLRFMASSMHE